MRLFWLMTFLVSCSSNGGSPPAPDAAGDVAMVEDTASSDVSEEVASACGCASYGAPTAAGTISATAITELSGLAASRTRNGVFYAHNDSGDTPRVFTIDEKGALLEEIQVEGAIAVDWEDIAVGPCGASSCVYVGDIGNNAKTRTDQAIYRFVEPAAGTTKVTAEKLSVAYPDGDYDAEALLVDPKGTIYVVTKAAETGLYRVPKSATFGGKITLERVGTVKGLSIVTAGDVSPCGDRVLLRTYPKLYEFRGDGVEAALAGTGVAVPVAKEPQGEAIAYRKDARGYATSTEGSSPTLSLVACE